MSEECSACTKSINLGAQSMIKWIDFNDMYDQFGLDMHSKAVSHCPHHFDH